MNICQNDVYLHGSYEEVKYLKEALKIVEKPSYLRETHLPIESPSQQISNLRFYPGDHISFDTFEGPNKDDVRKLSDKFGVRIEYYYSPDKSRSGRIDYLKGEIDVDLESPDEDPDDYDSDFDDLENDEDNESDDDQITY